MTSRKRRAPGASPMAQQTTFPDTAATPTDTYMNNWESPSGAADMTGFGDSAFYDQLGGFGANFGPQPSTHNRVVSLDGLNDGADQGAGTLIRRNQNQQLAARGRSPWGDAFNAQGQQGGWENTDDDEELERKAAIAKKDASAKRKTIPPFVQKLSRYCCACPTRTYINLVAASLTTATTPTSFAGQMMVIPSLFWTRTSSRGGLSRSFSNTTIMRPSCGS